VGGLVDQARVWLPVRCLLRFRAVNGRDRAFVLASQAFTTVIPLLIVVGALAQHHASNLVANRFNNRFHLTGASAQALAQLFQRPPGTTGTITVLSLVVLLPSLVGLTRSLRSASGCSSRTCCCPAEYRRAGSYPARWWPASGRPW